MKFYKAHRHTYWSSAKWTYKFKDTIPQKFYPLNSIGFDELRASMNKPKPLIDIIMNTLQDIVFIIPDCIHSINVYINNRFKTKTHVLTSNLSKGEWHEYDKRVAIVLSDSFMNWMETEYCRCNKFDADKLIEKHLWESNIKYDDDMFVKINEPIYGTPTAQAINAKKLFEIYQYFKYQRPSIVKFTYDNYMDSDILCHPTDLYEELDTKYLSMIIENRGLMWA